MPADNAPNQPHDPANPWFAPPDPSKRHKDFITAADLAIKDAKSNPSKGKDKKATMAWMKRDASDYIGALWVCTVLASA